MFVTDRGLLVLEPSLFRDVVWVGQRLVSGVGAVSGTTLAFTSQDVGLDAAGLTEGHVVTVAGAPYEVIERLSATSATISRLRASKGDAPLPPSPATGQPIAVVSFRPQIAMIHAQVLRMLGIEPGDGASGAGPNESDIKNPEALERVEALGAIHLIFAAAAALSPPNSSLWARAEMYRQRFACERQRAAARIDLNGDGQPDATRRLNFIQFFRA